MARWTWPPGRGLGAGPWRDRAGGVLGRGTATARAALVRQRYVPGTAEVDLGELVSPLRYDILVRADYFAHLARHLDDVDRDFDGYVAACTALPYFTWFRCVALARYRPGAVGSTSRVLAAFRHRVRRSTALYRSFQRSGFDPRQPITLRVARQPPVTSTGKCVPRAVYAGDGCHRLALLILSGATRLSPEHYRMAVEPVEVIDNTRLLLGPLRVTPEQYAAYLSRGYAPGRTFPRLDELRAHLAQSRPDRLAEFDRVVGVDAAALATPPPGLPVTDQP